MRQISVKLNPQIKTYDIDIAGHVNNTVYIKWFEDLRTKLFNEYFNLPELLSNNLYPVVVSTEVFYKKFLKLFDKPIGVMYMESLNHGIITLNAEIKLNSEIVTIGKQKCTLLDLGKLEIVNGEKLQKIINLNPKIL
ncbi:MAG: thioesterase family protein [Ignavibacteriaceae bacterium]|nr:thioesterase family protein [Ignavibacteriaceae bacterium]